MNSKLGFINNVSEYGDYLYFVSGNNGILFRMNKKNYSYEIVSYLPWQKYIRAAQIFIIDKVIVCISLSSDEILTFDLNDFSIKRYMSGEDNEKLFAFKCDNKIVIVPRMTNSKLTFFNIEDSTFEIKDIISNLDKRVLAYNYDPITQKLVVTFFNSSDVAMSVYPFSEWDQIKMEEQVHSVFKGNDGRYLFTSKDTNTLFKIVDGGIEKNKYGDSGKRFLGGFFMKDKLVLSTNSEIYLCENKELKLIKTIDNKSITSLFIDIKKVDGSYFMFPWNPGEFFVLDSNFNIVDNKVLELTLEEMMKKEKILIEDAECSLENYICLVSK